MTPVEFENCLRKGFIDYRIDADEHYYPQLVTNNLQCGKKVLDTIINQLKACDYFFFSVAFVTKGGIACLKDVLLDLSSRPVPIKGRIMVSQYLNFTEPGALQELLKFNNLEIRMLPEDCAFHAKGYSFRLPKFSDRAERYTMLIGSSNLTDNALTKNQEWNLFLTSKEDGDLIKQINKELEMLWERASVVNNSLIEEYNKVYQKNYQERIIFRSHKDIKPNSMQIEALDGIEAIRKENADRALIISATGTGKTYLSAFDVQRENPNKFLFLIHREIIASKSKESYEQVFCRKEDTGMLSGNHKDIDKKYLFSTVQTMSQDDVMYSFAPNTFDYIVVDEVHHAGAPTYQKLFNYFKPKFWLGMTATPERTDGNDIFDLFHHNIAYEIRLQKALEEDLLVPFHYHGISEIELNGKLLDEDSSFNELTSEERVKNILHFADFYGSDGDRIKGLVFCSRREEAIQLASMFVEHGKKALALCGENDEAEREAAIERLEKDKGEPDALDYIFTVNIFNEGVDIPKVNQIIMLRPTESAIVFVQQLGRGLRKAQHKRYIEVLDFIGNYKNNFLLPIALYGDRTYNKDNVRRLLTENILPGASTVHFDDIIKEKIFESINRVSQLADYKELKESFKNMQFRLGRQPMMMDFVRQGDKDPYLFIARKESYYEFVQAITNIQNILNDKQRAVLKMVSLELAQGRRVEEIAVLQQLIKNSIVNVADFQASIKEQYGFEVSNDTVESVACVLNLQFFTDQTQRKYQLSLINYTNNEFSFNEEMKELLTNTKFKDYFTDVLAYGRYSFDAIYEKNKDNYVNGFIRYAKYSRKDVCRILNRPKDVSSTMYGYRVMDNCCPIFVTYEKDDAVSARTNYADQFVSQQEFSWMTRSNVRLSTSSEVPIINKVTTRKLLFVKKSDGEGTDFYYLGDVSLASEPIETTMKDDKNKVLPVVNYRFKLDKPVEDKLYSYLNTKTCNDKKC